MPDLLTGEEEKEVIEAIDNLRQAQARLDPVSNAIDFASLQQSIDALSRTIESEVPTPQLCKSCNPPEDLPKNRCEESGHILGLDGFAIEQPAYLSLEQSA